MKRFFLLLLMAAISAGAMAIPAKRVQRTATINGRQVVLTLVGDENMHYWQAADGTAYRFTNDERVEQIDLSIARENIQRKQTVQMQRMAELSTTPDGMRRAGQMNRVQYQGERRGLVILANFKDKKFSITNPKSTYEKVMSQEGYKGNNQYGSVRDYFKAQSYGQFDFVLDVVGPVTLSQNMAYYGGNDASGSDLRPAHMAKEACELADAAGVDFTPYDWDNDGVVEQVFIVYAGYGEAQGGSANTIWPHAWAIEGCGSTLTLDGKRISSYACGSELRGASGTNMDGIGTICHEFSHCFGLPDFYCTDYNHDELTMSYWSIMDHGSYSNNGYCPTAYTAYERWFCGWMEPKVLDKPETVTDMKDIESSDDAYILYNQKNKNEYYIMYNVQQNGWNSYAMGHGMLVLHVDYNSSAWYENKPNIDADHLRMTPICADNERGTYYSTSFAGDPYPGTKKNTSLTDTSTPAAELFNKNSDGRYYMGKPIEKISESSKGLISFIFDGGMPVPATPTGVATESNSESFTISWDKMEYAEKYELEYGEYDQEAMYNAKTYVDETFDFGLSTDGTVDVSGSLDDIFTVPGFTGSKLYKGKQSKGLKFGTSSTRGYLNTPALQFTSSEVEVIVTVTPYNSNVASAVSFTRLNEEGTIMEPGQTFEVNSEGQTVSATLSTEGMSKIRIGGSTGRMYMQSIIVREKVNPYGEAHTVSTTDNSVTVTPDNMADAYYYQVRAVNSTDMASAWTGKQLLIINKFTPPAPMADAPENLTAVQQGESFEARWDVAPNAIAYTLEYRPQDGEWLRLENITDNFITITPANLVRNYDVRVLSLNADYVEGEWSEEAHLTFEFPVTAPVVTAVKDDDDSFTASWEAVDNAVAYSIEYGAYDNQSDDIDEADRFGTPETTSTGATLVKIEAEADSCAYYVKVAAINRFGDLSDWSETQLIVFIPTAIGSIKADSQGTVIYTVDGKRVSNTCGKGLYITNGKKRLVK